MPTIPERLNQIRQSIKTAAATYGRDAATIELLAVSKGQPLSAIISAYEAGQRLFGENYWQEAWDKITALTSQCPDIEWHFIGNLQRNKTRKIAENFAWVQSISDRSIATRLNEQRPHELPPLNICLEVNISAEETKHGLNANVERLYELANHCLGLHRLRLRGLMAIPKAYDDEKQQRQAFQALTMLYQSLQAKGIKLDTLSMGMSHDFAAAIAEGSTMVRIGTALFGPRN